MGEWARPIHWTALVKNSPGSFVGGFLLIITSMIAIRLLLFLACLPRFFLSLCLEFYLVRSVSLPLSFHLFLYLFVPRVLLLLPVILCLCFFRLVVASTFTVACVFFQLFLIIRCAAYF